MKKLISIFVICLMSASLTGCGSTNTEDTTNKEETNKEEVKTKPEEVTFSKNYEGELVEFKDVHIENHLPYLYSDYNQVESLENRQEDWTYDNSKKGKEFIRLLENLSTQEGVSFHTNYKIFENDNIGYINLKSETNIRYWDKEAVGIWYNQVNPDEKGSSGLICKLYIENGKVKSEGTDCDTFVEENSKKFENINTFTDIYKPTSDGLFEEVDNDGSSRGLKYTNEKEIILLRYDGGYMLTGLIRVFKYNGKVYIEESVIDYNKFAKLDPIF